MEQKSLRFKTAFSAEQKKRIKNVKALIQSNNRYPKQYKRTKEYGSIGIKATESQRRQNKEIQMRRIT